jgi:hypothetical protein
MDIDQDLYAQERLWRAQKVGRFIWAAVLLLGLIGIFGGGPVSQAIAKDADDILEVEYQRFAHIDTSDVFELRLGRGAAIGGKVHLWIDADFLEQNPVQRFTPEPVASRLENNRAVFEFDAADNLEIAKIVLETESSKAGMKTVAMGLLGGSEIRFWKFFWP